MKYIRTKDRIREIIEDFGCNCNVKSTYQKGRPSIDNFTVVRGVRFAPRANAIEELCDEFVWDEDLCHIDFKKKTLEIKKDDYEFDLAYCLKDSPIYGAIWTDKGLIYVTKMNDKGELELL